MSLGFAIMLVVLAVTAYVTWDERRRFWNDERIAKRTIPIKRGETKSLKPLTLDEVKARLAGKAPFPCVPPDECGG